MMNSLQNTSKLGSNSTQSLSFDDVANYFSLPLSDAATHLGVCVSVLKKICRENGLDRWPYRKFLCGKSIEEIKKYAAREKYKQIAELSKLARQSAMQPQNNNMSKLHGVSSPTNLPQQQGSKNTVVGQPQVLLNASLTKGTMAPDEFKYGFPSDGLSTATYKWWGSSSSDVNGSTNVEEAETDEVDKNQSEEKADGSATSIVGNKISENVKKVTDIDPQGSGLLTAIRKRSVEEGKEALKLGLQKKYCVKKLGRKERLLLLRVFGSALPKEWVFESS
ncbi:protein NLP4 isoform X2 [Pistacia vera]|uniref:Uncharacterized protein n=1 Tax=Pistacia atlantica TaxID=434234 RepID=A0ACC1CB42_9ROSI|nr:protein NLP4 isoform X1 [Pistacia vera]XP_031257195.1 protein NLP4 isoform X2 [Pistacia vera]KAJ0112940.1 hypothetical protein Patl1_01440 [Pistacia atlantica]